jgi:hypothetical protein
MGGSLSTNATQPQGYKAKSKCWGTIAIPRYKGHKGDNAKKGHGDEGHQHSNHKLNKY